LLAFKNRLNICVAILFNIVLMRHELLIFRPTLSATNTHFVFFFTVFTF